MISTALSTAVTAYTPTTTSFTIATAATASAPTTLLNSALSTPLTNNIGPMSTTILNASLYMTAANLIYLARRSHLRKMSKRQLLQIRLTQEPGVSNQLYVIILLTWQIFVAIFPIVEILARLCGKVSFFYSYPNAHGLGFILEPLHVQHLKMNKRVREQIRLDWHRFSVNVGGVGRDGFRHPPSREMNMLHLDIPKKGMKHWPWRRRHVHTHHEQD